MKLLDSNYLNDGKPGNDGRPARLIEIEDDRDFDLILENIKTSSYYGTEYLDRNLGYRKREIKPDNLLLAAIIEYLEPGNVFEFGCGSGDVLFLLSLREKYRLSGLDISRAIIDAAPESLRGDLLCGDLLAPDLPLAERGPFDLLTGFDIWEHLHPELLRQYLAKTVQLATPEAMFFYIVPCFGRDRVFGEVFPLEFEENREAFQNRRPFPYLVAERIDPPIPASGHLTWAHVDWWEDCFKQAGLLRCEALERQIQNRFGFLLHRAQRSFFILRRDNARSKARAEGLSANYLSPFRAWQLIHIFDRAIKLAERAQGRELMDFEKTLAITDNALETMLASFQRPRPLALRIRGKLKKFAVHWRANR